jgi:hypothetical protein
MPSHYLVGPVAASSDGRFLGGARGDGRCRTFGYHGGVELRVTANDTWDQVLERLPADWRPEFVVLRLAGTSIPGWIWAAPIPLVGMAADCDRHWHHYRRCLTHCDLVVADAADTAALTRAGAPHVLAGVSDGSSGDDLQDDGARLGRDIDLLVLDDFDPVDRRERLRRIARLARLAGRYHVVIRGGVDDADRRTLLRRARIVFVCDHADGVRLTAEAHAAGALVIQLGAGDEIPAGLIPGQDYVRCTGADLEATLDSYLSSEVDRATIASAGRAKAAGLSATARWAETLRQVEAEWGPLGERSTRRSAVPSETGWIERAWQWLNAIDRSGDPNLVTDLAAARAAGQLDAVGHYVLGLVAASAAESAAAFTAAATCHPSNVLAKLARAEALCAIGQRDTAASAVQAALAALDSTPPAPAPWMELPLYAPKAALLRAEWERAGSSNAGEPAKEAAAKRAVLRWRLNALLADLTGRPAFFHEAAAARPDLPEARAALGCAWPAPVESPRRYRTFAPPSTPNRSTWPPPAPSVTSFGKWGQWRKRASWRPTGGC